MKKFTMIFMVVLIFFMPIFNTFNQQIAHANIISKPLTITAKKVAKELAQNSAVEMAEHILFEKAMNEFLNTDMTDPDYKAVCLDGAKTFDDCSPDKRAQIKEKLTSSDRANLSNKVEEIIERKTNTSSKWTKFLDWFIPIFLISGVVATFDSLMDSDSEGLIDDIAKESLQETGLLKGLNSVTTDNGTNYNFANYVEPNITKSSRSDSANTYLDINFTVKPNKILVFTSVDRKGVTQSTTLSGATSMTATIGRSFEYLYNTETKKNEFIPFVQLSVFTAKGTIHLLPHTKIWENPEFIKTREEAEAKSLQKSNELFAPVVNANTASDALNAIMRLYGSLLSVNVETMPDAIVPIEVGTQPGLERLKNPDGTVTTPGIDSFKYTHGQNEIYPSPDSTTGWKEKTTGEDIQVVEDEIAVDTEIDAPPAEEDPDEEFPSCKKDLKKINFKKVGTAFTNAFPFSIPWDIKRFIDASFGGVGDTKPSFDLPDYLGGVKLEIPAFFDNWIGFMRTFVIIVFDISLIYLFYRIMRGGGGD